MYYSFGSGVYETRIRCTTLLELKFVKLEFAV